MEMQHDHRFCESKLDFVKSAAKTSLLFRVAETAAAAVTVHALACCWYLNRDFVTCVFVCIIRGKIQIYGLLLRADLSMSRIFLYVPRSWIDASALEWV